MNNSTNSSLRVKKDATVLQLMRPLDEFLNDPKVTDVNINRPGEVITKTFAGTQYHEVPALTMSYLNGLATALITYNGIQPKSRVSILYPGGQRGEILRSPAVIEGTIAFAIRKHSPTVKDLETLESEGAFSSFKDVSFHKPTAAECAEYANRTDFTRLEPFELELLALKREGRIREFLEACVHHKRNIIISGKTGSGKTTFARSLIEKVPYDERIVTIEDVHELFLENHKNRVHLLYGYGAGRISAQECLAACMRLLPDRIFLAELRGVEAWEYLNSLNTAHPGSITTTHANNAIQTFDRTASLIKISEIGRMLDMDLIKHVLHTTLDVVLYFSERKLVEVFYDPIFSKAKLA